MSTKKATTSDFSEAATATSKPTTGDRRLAVYDINCVVCDGLLDRAYDVCSACIAAFVDQSHRRRAAAHRLPVLDHSGAVDPWAGWSA